MQLIKSLMKKWCSVSMIIHVRRLTQAFFFILFLYLFLNTVYRGDFQATPEASIKPTAPIKFFFDLDPLIAVSSLLSTWSIYKGLIWSLIIIALTMIMGRIFCGWICPFGTLHHIAGTIKPYLRPLKRVEINKLARWQTLKYYLLIGFLVLSAFGSLQIGLLDPISLLWRSLATSVLPALSFIWNSTMNFIYASKIPYLFILGDYGSFALNKFVFPGIALFYHYGWLIGIIFILLIYVNRKVPRFWCRYLCPLGALLGYFSRLSIFGIEKKDEKCTDCNICLLDCQGAANPQGKTKWVMSECMMCLNCWDGCPEGVLKLKFFPKKESVQNSIDLKRRTVMLSVGAGAIFLPLSRASDSFDKNYNPYLIRPPGSVDEKDFLKRCIKCGNCMKICPTNALHPALFEGGIEGLWTPLLIARIGYCENTCILCGYTCPTGAIQELTEQEKLGTGGGAFVKIGLAAIDRGRCLPWAFKTPCIVCEEHCPTSPKAVILEKTVITDRNGKEIEVQLPYVDAKLCWGCGICENKCPVKDKPAIYVTNIGETRSKTNQLLLKSG